MVSGQLPPEENCPPVRVGVSVKVRVSFRVGGQPENCPREKLPPGQGQGLAQVQFWGWGAIFLEHKISIIPQLSFYDNQSIVFAIDCPNWLSGNPTINDLNVYGIVFFICFILLIVPLLYHHYLQGKFFILCSHKEVDFDVTQTYL